MKGKKIGDRSRIVDISDRNGYFRTMTSGFDRKFIDEHGVKQGIYNLYSKTAQQGEYRCEEELCNDELLILESRITAAIDTDGEIFKLESLSADLVNILTDTNKRVVLCMKHKAATAFVLGDQQKVGAQVVQFMRGANDRFPPRPPKKAR